MPLPDPPVTKKHAGAICVGALCAGIFAVTGPLLQLPEGPKPGAAGFPAFKSRWHPRSTGLKFFLRAYSQSNHETGVPKYCNHSHDWGAGEPGFAGFHVSLKYCCAKFILVAFHNRGLLKPNVQTQRSRFTIRLYRSRRSVDNWRRAFATTM